MVGEIRSAKVLFPGFRQDEGESSEGTSSATSSDSGTAFTDMSDLQPMSDAQASEHLFRQYRMHRRRWRRLTGKPVRRFCRSYASLRNVVAKANDVIMDLDLVVIEAADHTWSLRMTYVLISAPEGRELAVALEKGTVGNAIHAAVTDRR